MARQNTSDNLSLITASANTWVELDHADKLGTRTHVLIANLGVRNTGTGENDTTASHRLDIKLYQTGTTFSAPSDSTGHYFTITSGGSLVLPIRSEWEIAVRSSVLSGACYVLEIESLSDPHYASASI